MFNEQSTLKGAQQQSQGQNRSRTVIQYSLAVQPPGTILDVTLRVRTGSSEKRKEQAQETEKGEKVGCCCSGSYRLQRLSNHTEMFVKVQAETS